MRTIKQYQPLIPTQFRDMQPADVIDRFVSVFEQANDIEKQNSKLLDGLVELRSQEPEVIEDLYQWEQYKATLEEMEKLVKETVEPNDSKVKELRTEQKDLLMVLKNCENIPLNKWIRVSGIAGDKGLIIRPNSDFELVFWKDINKPKKKTKEPIDWGKKLTSAIQWIGTASLFALLIGFLLGLASIIPGVAYAILEEEGYTAWWGIPIGIVLDIVVVSVIYTLGDNNGY